MASKKQTPLSVGTCCSIAVSCLSRRFRQYFPVTFELRDRFLKFPINVTRARLRFCYHASALKSDHMVIK